MFDIEELDEKTKSKLVRHKQLSVEWFKQRKRRITGSKLSQFLFMNSVFDMRRLHEEIFEDRPRAEFDELSKRRCAFGRDHEIHATCCYLRQYPSKLFLEVTFQVHPRYPKWIGATSDGLLSDTEDGTIKLLEIKCPYGDFEGQNAKAFKTFPEYYVPQIIMQQMCYCVDTTHFVIWTRAAFKVYEVRFDPVYAESLMLFLKEFYDGGDMINNDAYCLAAVAALKLQTRAFKSRNVTTLSPRGGFKNSKSFIDELKHEFGPHA